ncbi:MAG: alpha/beta hydrolase [Erysipelotrichaceae bacterium]|nr:alpha/beta hydrolase [Erysipelotrichaceae bacterium]MBR5755577.1 alpha/beta hydrolase [Erysipelotrichaceae bacterium]
MLDIFETEIPQLIKGEKRKIYVYVPDMEGCFPVLYMFDGHNLFDDDEASFGKSWGMKDFLDENGFPLIVVGVECNHHSEKSRTGGRLSEYSPFDFSDPHWGKIKGRGKITMDFYVNELKPYIDDNYPTLPDRRYTFIGGSSMGGLMTLYAMCEYNDVYSRGASLSPSVIFAPEKVLEMINGTKFRNNTVLYMDYGQKEIGWRNTREIYGEVTSALIQKKVLLDSRVVPKGEHNEASWERAIPFFMETLFYRL